MTAVRYLELAGDAPQLRAEAIDLAALDAALQAARPAGPRFRLWELAAPGARLVSFTALWSLQQRAARLLHDPRVRDELRGKAVVRIDVSGGFRELHGTVRDLLQAQAEVDLPIVVLDIELPQARDAAGVDTIVATWEAALADDAPAAPRRLERGPPVAAWEPTARLGPGVLAQQLAVPDRVLDSAAVGRLLSGNPHHANPKMQATRARRRGEIFGVWDGQAFRYPAFQFDADGRPRAALPDLIAALPRDADGSGQDAFLWLFAPDAALDERTPADAFVDAPERVIALARQRREGGDGVD